MTIVFSGIIPVSYLLRNMGESNLRMRHHYLGGHGTKPLAEALTVSQLESEKKKNEKLSLHSMKLKNRMG